MDVSNLTEKDLAKFTIKDSVFTNLFGDKKYALELYKTLHPEDDTATEDDVTIVTLQNILITSIYNDLRILVRDKLLILVEEQSSWSENILVRMLMYTAETYRSYFNDIKESLYRSKKVKLPKPELYVVYPKDRENRPDIITLKDEFFGGEDSAIDVKAKIIYESNSTDIINQYITFCRVFDDKRKEYGNTVKAIEETIRICSDRDILREYLKSREKEVVTMMKMLFSNEEILTAYLNSEKREEREAGRAEGMEKGMEKGKSEAIKNIVDSLGVSLERAMEILKIPKSEYSKYAEMFNYA